MRLQAAAFGLIDDTVIATNTMSPISFELLCDIGRCVGMVEVVVEQLDSQFKFYFQNGPSS